MRRQPGAQRPLALREVEFGDERQHPRRRGLVPVLRDRQDRPRRGGRRRVAHGQVQGLLHAEPHEQPDELGLLVGVGGDPQPRPQER